jgi:hypothetical protein
VRTYVRHIPLALCVALVLVISGLSLGCGGGGEDEATSAAGGETTSAEATSAAGEGEESGGNKSAAKGGNGSGASGGGSQTAKADKTETRAEFFRNADAICRKFRAKTRSSPQFHALNNVANISKQKAQTVVVDGVIQYLEKELSQLIALRPPADAKDASQAMLNAIGEMIIKGPTYPQNFILKRELISEAEAIARANGFKVCGKI